ncbi:cation diffusion facilitator family transporter [Aspergillus affinis]|uniref:cation diffusion facilitator family transporter n=1 Tax=Aspergillus affinis TaxID=1070780 RepID=UPI0022FED48C|nr:uncharacterized protein KD926_010800 [Aspergillus affinis]KAI9038383.1 hypothetical protein KD926_010800 [Aspergillus affinis]
MEEDIELERLRKSVVNPPDTRGLSKRLHRRTRRAHAYHETQNLHINRLIQVAEDPTSTRILDDRVDSSAAHVKAAIYLSIYGTILVAVLQIYAAATTRSLSLFVTMAESCCEAVSNIGLDYLHRKSRKLSDSTRWPAGAGRLCNARNICFAFALMAVSLVLAVESIRALASPDHELGTFHVAAIIAAACGFGIKLFLAVYCFIFRRHSSQLEMLREDNRNDCFEYGFAIFTSAAGAKLGWWVDPAGALLIAFVIIATWIRTVYSEFMELCGLGAEPALVQEIVFLTLRHSDLILKVDTVNAYHWGEELFVEVDIVMAPERSLREVHDVSQELQDKLETVEGFGRAFVHVDYGDEGSEQYVMEPVENSIEKTDKVQVMGNPVTKYAPLQYQELGFGAKRGEARKHRID